MDIRSVLIEACSKLMMERTIEKITVAEILDQAGVSRATFYKYFRDKYELAGVSIVVNVNRGHYPFGPYSPLTLEHYRKTCREMYEARRGTVKLFTERSRLTVDYMAEGMQEVFEKRYAYVHGEGCLTDKVRWGIRHSIYGYLRTVEKWAIEGMKLPPDTLAEWLFEFRDPQYFV